MQNKQSILITGASSGIGKECALYLDKLGFMVFAGVRTNKVGEELKKEASDKLIPTILDVTKKETIASAVEIISQETEYPLFGLVNNAGVGLRGILETTPETELRNLLEVNVIGLHAVTRAFLPLLRNNKGRIVNIGSEASFAAGPNGSSYAASKFAVRAISDSLRLELINFDMHVSLVAPTSTHSDIWKKNKIYRENLHKNISSELREAYSFFLKMEERATLENIKAISSLEVAKSVAHALISKKPKYEYTVGKNSKKVYRLSLLPKNITTGYVIRRLIKCMNKMCHCNVFFILLRGEGAFYWII